MPPGRTTPRRLHNLQRQLQALELRKAGVQYSRIAEALGYNSENAAYQAVKAALKRTLQEPSDAVRKMEVERLDALLFKLWPERNNVFVVDRILKIMDRRAKLLGLDMPVKFQFDWRREVQEAGEDPSVLFNEMVALFLRRLEANAAQLSDQPDGDGAAGG